MDVPEVEREREVDGRFERAAAAGAADMAVRAPIRMKFRRSSAGAKPIARACAIIGVVTQASISTNARAVGRARCDKPEVVIDGPARGRRRAAASRVRAVARQATKGEDPSLPLRRAPGCDASPTRTPASGLGGPSWGTRPAAPGGLGRRGCGHVGGFLLGVAPWRNPLQNGSPPL